MKVSATIVCLGAIVVSTSDSQRIIDYCVNRDKKTCVLATSGAYLDSNVCSGWCDESKQCMGPGATMCPLEEMAWEDYGFVASIHWNAAQCTAIKAWGTAQSLTSLTIEGWCQPKATPDDFSLGHCTELPVICNTTESTLHTSPADIPCAYRGSSCFDCLATYDADPTPRCQWCSASQSCLALSDSCGTGASTLETSACPNENRYRAKALASKKRLYMGSEERQ